MQPMQVQHKNAGRAGDCAIYLFLCDFHRFFAAFCAISERLFPDIAFARAFPPLLPSSAAADLGAALVSIISPVAIRPTMIAAPITSAGRRSPLGPLGIVGTQELIDLVYHAADVCL